MEPSTRRDLPAVFLMIGFLAVLALQLTSAFGLVPAWWGSLSLPELIDPAVVTRAVVLAAAIVPSLRWLARPQLPMIWRVVLILALTALFRLTTLKAPIGDWQVLIWATEGWQTIGKWYGSSLVFGAFHHLLGAPLGLSAEESVMLCASLSGALLLLVLGRAAARLQLPVDALAWRGALLAGFASYGLALGHREIYSLVFLAVAFTLERWIMLCEQPNTRRAVWAGAALGITLTLYLGAIGLIPAALMSVARLLRSGAWRAAAIALLACAIFGCVILGLGPPTFERSLVEEWQRQAARGDVLNQHGRPYFLPPDVQWTLVTNFVAPRYWLAWWHLRDLASCLLFASPVSVPLTLYGLLRLTRRPRASLASGGWVAMVGAGSFAAIGALVVPGIPLPWDWDLFGFYFTPLIWWSSLYVAPQFEPTLRSSRSYRVAAGIWTCFGLGLALAMFHGTTRPPSQFGPSRAGISIAAMPERLEVGGKPFVWLWIRNETEHPIEVRTDQLELRLIGNAKPQLLRSETVKQLLRGTRRIQAGASVPLTHLFWTARDGPLSARTSSTTQRAYWEVRLRVDPQPGELEWSSQEVELAPAWAVVQ